MERTGTDLQGESGRGTKGRDSVDYGFDSYNQAIEREVSQTVRLRWCVKVAGTLCWRDGFKTGTHTPNGQDAYDFKLVVEFGGMR